LLLVRADRRHGSAGRFLFVMRGVNFSGNHPSNCKSRRQASREAFLSMVKDQGGTGEQCSFEFIAFRNGLGMPGLSK
jgi:hypothetical protein